MKRYCKIFGCARIILVVFCLVASSEVLAEQWGPLITTDWNQGDMAAINHYNKFCPTDPFEMLPSPPYPPDTLCRCPVGCVATALGQIINYWEYPSSISFDQSDEYHYHIWRLRLGEIHKKVTVDADHQERDFPTFAALNSHLSSIAYNLDPAEEAYFCFGLGVKLEMAYEFDGSGSYTRAAGSVLLKDLSYGSAIAEYDEDSVWTTKQKQRVIENIKTGWPVQMGIRCEEGGHSVVVDGYNDSTDEFHINFGWAGDLTDPWYSLPEFDAGGYHWDLVHTLVYDICQYQGWSQWGADERNSFGTIYTYPVEEPYLKWKVTVPSNLPRYSFDYMVVGTSNKIYASLSPCDMGQGNYPYICVINPYGYIEKTIPISECDYPIDYLTQNHRGEIFFGTSEFNEKTSIYRIDPKTESVTRILDHTSPDRGNFNQPIKVDKDDFVYFIVEPRFTINYGKFYSTTRSGTLRWSHSFSPEMKLYRSVAAIDETHNQVYLNYYNDSAEKSYLMCFDRSVGTVKWTHAFPGTHKASAMVGVPAVGRDGTIYIGCYTTLYALYPTTGNEKWSQSFHPAYTSRTPAIGQDGTLYVNYGKMIGSVWHPGFIRDLDPANGSTKWEREISPPLGDYDNMGDIYSAGNDMIGFTYNRSDVAHIGGLIDHGDSGEILWDVEYGGKMIFGPGQTIYVVHSTCVDTSSIYALSVGERGDPDGLGMGFTNNEAPNVPYNPNPVDGKENLDTTVTLSWECSDPEDNPRKYSLFVGESGYDMVPVATDFSDTSYSLSSLTEGTGYAWKIIATDGQAVNEGPTWVFATKTQPLVGDFCGANFGPPDGYVDVWDLMQFADQWHTGTGDPEWDSKFDLAGPNFGPPDGYIDVWDLMVFADHWHEGQKP